MSSSSLKNLGAALNKPPLSVEVLPGEGSAWLNDDIARQQGFVFMEDHLGIPQKLLYRTYLEAIASFNRSRGASLEASGPQAVDLSHSSAILLLANPAYQTAWNMRKRLVELSVLDSERELGFCAALLTVRDCAKQSLLWHHRRWLLRRMFRPQAGPTELISTPIPITLDGSDEDALRNLEVALSVLRGEFDLCTLASNTYERNYFAWSHRYRCLEALIVMRATARSSDSNRVNELNKLLREESTWCSQWIERHASDYTAMQYQYRLVDALWQLKAVFAPIPGDESLGFLSTEGIWRHTKELVKCYPDHDALWLYLRGAFELRSLADRNPGDTYREEAEDFAKEQRDLLMAYQGQKCNMDHRAVVLWNIARFLAWLHRQTNQK